MTNTISIPFSDAQCVAIISTWLHGPAGRVWCRRAEQSDAQATRWHLTLNADGADAWWGEEAGPCPLDLQSDIFPQCIREAIGKMLASANREERNSAAMALVNGGGIDNYTADSIVQVAILGRIVFG